MALVEFTLVAPLLMLLLFGMLDFGKAFNYWIDATHLANTGARMAVVNNWPTKGTETLQDYLVSEADTPELKANASACIEFDPGAQTGDPVKITLRTEYQWLPIITNMLGFGTTTIRSSSTMRLEKDPPYSYSPDDNHDDC